MENVKIFHMADAHLDAPFSTLPPNEAELARRSLRSAFAAAVLAAKNRGVQLFFISGDLFDSDYITPDTREFVCDKLADFPSCRFFIAPGNHDPFNELSPYGTMPLPSNVHVFRGRERVSVEELGVDVYGYGFTDARNTESPIVGHPDLDKSKINILVCHGDVGALESAYGPITHKQIGESGFDYIALGHIHKGSGVLCENGVYYAYPGCIEGRGFDEVGDKGALCGTVGKNGADLAFLSLARRKYAVEQLDISDMEERTQVVEAIRDLMRPYGSDTHLRVVLKGMPTRLFTVKAELFETGGSNPVSVEIVDKSVPMPRLTDIEKEKTLRGTFVRRMQARLATVDADSEEYAACQTVMRLVLAALDGRDITGV